MSHVDAWDEIAAAVTEAHAALDRAHALIAEQCAGPHRYVQHRDGRGPWCPVCGYGADGHQVRTALPVREMRDPARRSR